MWRRLKQKKNIFFKECPQPPQNDEMSILEIWKIEEKKNSEKMLYKIEKGKKTDPPKPPEKLNWLTEPRRFDTF